MTTILKLLMSVTVLSICVYGVNIFGFSVWPILFSTLSVFLLVLLYYTKLNTMAVIVAKTMGVLSLLAWRSVSLADLVGK